MPFGSFSETTTFDKGSNGLAETSHRRKPNSQGTTGSTIKEARAYLESDKLPAFRKGARKLDRK